MAHAKIEFESEEKDKNLRKTFKAKIGFNEAPAWVGKSKHFKLCQTAGLGARPLVTAYESTPTDNALAKSEADNKELRDRIEAMEIAAEKAVTENALENEGKENPVDPKSEKEEKTDKKNK